MGVHMTTVFESNGGVEMSRQRPKCKTRFGEVALANARRSRGANHREARGTEFRRAVESPGGQRLCTVFWTITAGCKLVKLPLQTSHPEKEKILKTVRPHQHKRILLQ